MNAEQAASPASPPAVEIVQADLDLEEHQRAVLAMTESYAHDPFGKGGPLRPEVLLRLIPALKAHPTTLIFLAFTTGPGDRLPVGIATCFLGFSTFYARPLVNIHDVAVLPELRGRGIGAQLLAAVDRKARALGCCRLTLEVAEANARARKTYEKAGFSWAVPGEGTGGALFYMKTL